MTAIGYYELPGTAHYEWRADEGSGLCGWQDSGHVSPGLLAELRETLGAMPYYEIRVVVSLMDEAGVYAGLLIRAARLQGGTDLAMTVIGSLEGVTGVTKRSD